MALSELEHHRTLESYNNAAPVYLDSGFKQAKKMMLHGLEVDRGYSLTTQLGLLGIGNNPVPDIVAVTLNTAVPMADVVRGVYEAASMTQPKYIGIKANLGLGLLYSLYPDFILEHECREEVERLKYIVDGKIVTVIDEFVATGGTTRVAEAMLENAGALATRIIGGRWYHNLGNIRIDTDKITSSYSEPMREVGHDVLAEFQLR